MEIIDKKDNHDDVSAATTTLTDVERERVRLWKEKEAKEVSPLQFTCDEVSQDKIKHIRVKCTDSSYRPFEQRELIDSTLCAASGSASPEFSGLLFSQTMSGLFMGSVHNSAFMSKAIQDTLLAMSPSDVYEGILCSRLIVLQNQYMEFMSRSAYSAQTEQGVDLNINRATKLMRVYNETLEALSKYRRKGEQKVTVQHHHVNVEKGGQAVVGTINTGGGAYTKSEGAPDAN